MVIHESAENYLETILIIKNEQGKVRSIDIARAMNYSKPSISRAMRAPARKRLHHHGRGRLD